MLNDTSFSVLNTGDPLGFPETELFSRFKKGKKSEASNGLGLAIIKEIVMLHNWRIQYRYAEGKHCFEVFFKL